MIDEVKKKTLMSLGIHKLEYNYTITSKKYDFYQQSITCYDQHNYLCYIYTYTIIYLFILKWEIHLLYFILRFFYLILLVTSE